MRIFSWALEKYYVKESPQKVISNFLGGLGIIAIFE